MCRQPPRWALAHHRASIDEISRIVGLVAIWLVLLCALVSAVNAVDPLFERRRCSGSRRTPACGLFGALYTLYADNSNALSDTTWYMFAGIVMLGGAWTLKVNAHVRVDLSTARSASAPAPGSTCSAACSSCCRSACC